MQKINSVVAVSCVIPCFRCQSTIHRAVGSIALQTYMPQEVILIDDASDDGTLAELHALQALHPDWIKVLSQPVNLGAASARNMGWEHATGDYVAFLDADDTWHPRKIEIQYTWMQQHVDVGISGHGYLVKSADRSQDAPLPRETKIIPLTGVGFLYSNPYATRTVMLRRKLAHRFEQGKRYSEDYQLWMEIILSGVASAYIHLPLAATYKHDYGVGGLSANLWRMEQGELEAYRYIYRNRLISVAQFYLSVAVSWVKFLRRLVLVGLKKYVGKN